MVQMHGNVRYALDFRFSKNHFVYTKFQLLVSIVSQGLMFQLRCNHLRTHNSHFLYIYYDPFCNSLQHEAS